MKKSLLFSLFYLLFVLVTLAQDNKQWEYFYSAKPNEYTYPNSKLIVQENDTLWVASDVGLIKMNRKNGEVYAVYHAGNSDFPPSICRSIDIDSEGNKWIATDGGGVVKFDGNNFTIYSPYSTDYPGGIFNSPFITYIVVDKENSVWFEQNQGLRKLKDSNLTAFRTIPYVNKIFVDSLNNKWIASEDGVFKIKADDSVETFPSINASLRSKRVHSIQQDTLGNTWILTDYEIVRFKDNDITVYNATNTNSLENFYLFDIYIDENNVKWIEGAKNNQEKMLKFNDTTWEEFNRKGYLQEKDSDHNLVSINENIISIITPNDSLNFMMPKDSFLMRKIEGAEFDNNKNLWILSSDKLHKYNQKSWRVIDKNDTFTCLKKMDGDTLWVNSHHKGLGKIVNDSILYLENSSIDWVFDMTSETTESGNKKWIASISGVYTVEGNEIINYNMDNSILPSDYINCIAIDLLGRKWIGTDNGLVKIDGNQWQIFNSSNSALYSDEIRCISIDKNNTVWIGTYSNFAKYENDVLSHVRFGSIPFIYVDKENTKWFSDIDLFNGEGIIKYSNNGGISYINSTNSGILNDYPNLIKEDYNGNLWIMSRTGISVYYINCPSTITNPISSIKVANYIYNSETLNNLETNYQAGKAIELKAGFSTPSNAVFTAKIGGCKD
jgi:ligand-binding sensor domain-containing protein